MLLANIDPKRSVQSNNQTRMTPTSTNNGANLAQGVDIGYPQMNNNMKKTKKMQTQSTELRTNDFLSAAISSKLGGLNGWAFTDVL